MEQQKNSKSLELEYTSIPKHNCFANDHTNAVIEHLQLRYLHNGFMILYHLKKTKTFCPK